MLSIRRCELPQSALLCKYRDGGAFTDCYVTDIVGRVSHAEYVEAFYTTRLFKAERLVLTWFAAKPSTDLQARQLAAGTLESFAAWRLEARAENQLLLSDIYGRTRSWLMVAAAESGNPENTRLYFGSAVVPRATANNSAARSLGLVFNLLLPFHKLYSRTLLFAAKARLLSMRADQ